MKIDLNKTNFSKWWLILLLILSNSAFAAIKLPGFIGDNMVIQRNKKVLIWGWDNPGESISLVFKGETYHAKAMDADGKWMIKLDPSDAGGPYNMSISDGKDNILIKNILVGDVWLCSGQSNMVFDFNSAGERALYAKEIAGSTNDEIRQVIINRAFSSHPQANCKTNGWHPANPQNIIAFTAAGYFFALNLYQKYHVPIGLINSSYGGTVAEAWTSEGGLKELPQFAADINFLKDSAAVYQKIADYKNRIKEWDSKCDQDDPGYDRQGNALWVGDDFDDSQWDTMPEHGFWDQYGYRNNYGTFWFRKEIDIPQTAVGKDAVLQLGRLDDADVTYFNGQIVGHSANRDIHRMYNIPASIIKPGKNIIAIRIINYNGTGGFFPEDTLQFISGVVSQPITGQWKFKQGAKMGVRSGGYDAKNLPTALYNAMIAPLIPCTMKGVIWYQGEYNTHKAFEYRKLFPAMITDWRSKWGVGNFPFIFVQLPNFGAVVDHPTESEWAELREAQLMTLSLPKTAMAVTIDIGKGMLHPFDKKDVGYRLSLAARKLAYGEKDLVASGPLYKSMKIEGNKIVISFKKTGGKLVSKGGGPLTYFEIAGADKKFVWATAKIVGNKVVVYSDKVPNPVAVRYAWANNPDGCNLYNDAGLPASPFRTDDWPGLTVHNLKNNI